jgi:hypothetical protein
MENTLQALSWLSELVWGNQTKNLLPEMATVHLYRIGEKKALFRKFNVWVNGKYVGKLRNWSSLVLVVEPGKLRIEAALSGLTLLPRRREVLSLDVVPGELYYVQGDHRSGLLRGYLGLSEVTETTWKRYWPRFLRK